MNIDQAIAESRNASVAKGSEGCPNDNVLYDRMVAAYRALHAHGSDGIDSVRSLLQDSSPDVRSWVAAQLLATGDSAALPVLEEIAKGSGIIAFNAQMTLKEYLSGSLLPPLGEPAA